MAITLQQPLGTDVYNVAVFNSNAQIVQDTINSILTAIDNINLVLPKKMPFINVTDNSFNIDENLEDGIYYLSVLPTGTLPQEAPAINNILIAIGNSTQTLITSNSKIYQRVFDPLVDTDWISMTTNVVDDLTTQSATDSLSANQGYILNNSKLSISYPEEIDLNSIEQGIYVCNKIVSVTGTVPSVVSTPIDFIFESYGKIGETPVFQSYLDIATNLQFSRFGNLSTDDTWYWTNWSTIEGGGGGGDASAFNLCPADPDNIIENGIYYNDNVTTYTNIPTGYELNYIIHINNSDTQHTQTGLFISSTTQKLKWLTRSFSSDTWSSWEDLEGSGSSSLQWEEWT